MNNRAQTHSKTVADGVVALMPVMFSLQQRGAVLLYVQAGMGYRERPAISISAHPHSVTNWLRAQGAELIKRSVGVDGPQDLYRYTFEGVDVEWQEPAAAAKAPDYYTPLEQTEAAACRS